MGASYSHKKKSQIGTEENKIERKNRDFTIKKMLGLSCREDRLAPLVGQKTNLGSQTE
jgi:hypothetical protein